MRNIILAFVIISLVGCGSPMVSTRTVPPPKLDEYVNMPFNKFVNRLYLNDVKDKYIRLESDYGGMYSSQNVGGYPQDEWIRISIVKDGIAFDNVMVPKSEAELCFNLKRGEPITVYGKTTVWSMSYASIKQPDQIALIVSKIERRQATEVIRLPDTTGWTLVNVTQRGGIESKIYQNAGNTISIQYKGGKPIGFMRLPVPPGQNMTTYCDRNGDGIFETIMTNNPYCE